MAQDKLDILYDALERDGAVTSGRENFRAKMLAPGEEGYKNRLALFTALKQDNAVESNTYEEFAANLGLHAVKPAKQEDPAEEQGRAAQPNADDYARAAKNNALSVARGRDVLHQAENAQEWQKANFGLNVPKVEIGLGKSGRTVATAPTFNAKTGKQERTYITQSGNEYTSQASAEREQAALDKQQEQARKLAHVQEEIDRKRQEELAGIDKQLTVMQEQYDRIKGTDHTSETRKGYIMQAIDRLQQQRDAAEKKYRGRDVKAEYELGGGREQLEAAKEEVAKALKDIEERRGEKSGFMEFAESQFPNVTSYIRRWTDPEYGKAKAAEQALKDTENTIKQATREGFSNNTAFNVARGAWDATRDIRTWDFGANDWADSRNLAELVDKSERIRKDEEAGKTPEEHLTATEQRVLDAMAVSSTLDANFSEHVPMSYRVGQSVPASAGFAASIYLNPLNGLGAAVEKQVAANAAKGGMKEVLKGAMKTAGKTVMKNVTGAPTMNAAEQSMQRALTVAAVNKYGKWGVRAMNTAGRVIGDGVEALGTTLTTGLPRTMASINERQTGTFIGRVDDSGRIVYDRVEDRETGAKSYLKGGLASYFENQSELVGEYFSPIKNFANLAAKDMPLARSMVERFIASSPKQKASLLAEFRKKAHISGLFGEYAEEVINNLENAVFTGDMNLTGGVFEPKRENYKSDAEYNKAVNKWKGSMFNAETNLETFLSVAAMIMPMAAIEQGQKRYNSYTVKRQLNTSADALRKSLGEETAVPLMTRMREAESIKDICDVYMSVLKDGGLKDSKQARALMDYAGKLVAYQSVNTSDMAGEISANRVQRGYKSAFDAGHEMAADERHNAAVEFDNAAATATEMLGKDFVMAVRDMDLPHFQEILKTLNWEQKKAATDVYLSSVRLSGIMAGAHDRVDEEADKYGNTLNLMSDEDGNAWRGSNLGENEYVVPSSLSEEGSTLVVRDMETGALHMIPREEAGELTAVNASEETEARRQQLWEQAKDEVRWNLNHHNKTVQPAVGETVSISMRKSEDEDNETQRFLIVKEDEDGNFYLLPTRMNEAGEEEAISGTPFKATADELLSSQDYVYEQEDAAQRDAERSAVEETTEGGATEETPTDGSSVVIEGTPATEEDAPADTAVPTRSEVAAQLDATEEGRSARAMVDGWVRDENDAETIHEWIDIVDESEWDAKTKQLLHDYVDSNDAPDKEGTTGGSSAVVEGKTAPTVESEAAPAVESESAPKIPLDKDGAPQYDKAPVQVTVEDLYDGTLDDKEVGEFIEAQIAEADKNVKKLEKRKPKVGTDKAKYLASKKKWEDEMEDARHKAQYWNDVKAEVERITTPADAQGWEGELNDDNARAAYRAQRKAENGIPTQQEFIADFMASAKIAPESFRKETGGGTLEQKQWAGRIAKEGDSIERLSEKLVDLDNTENGGRFFGGDSAAARDAIIDFLKSGRDKTDQELEFVEQYNAQRDAYYNERYGMSYEDYIAYTEQEMPEMLRRYSNFDEQEFTNLYADEIEEDLRRREEQAKQQNNGTEGNDSAGEEQSDGGSRQVQLGERTDDTRRGEERTDARAEEDAGDEGAGKPEATQENAGAEAAGGRTANVGGTPELQGDIPSEERVAKREKSSATNEHDSQGNPLNADGTLKLEKVESIDDITDEDFSHPTRNVELPQVPENVGNALGTDGKPVIIKKNIFERNAERHKDLSPSQSRVILFSALYNADLYGQNQKAKRPYNWVVINTKDEKGHNRIVLLEINPSKNAVEIIHWHYVNDKNLGLIKKQAIREGGQVLILPSENSEEVGGLSNLTDGQQVEKNGGELVMLSSKDKVESLSTPQHDLSSDGKGSTKLPTEQEKGNIFAKAERLAEEERAKREKPSENKGNIIPPSKRFNSRKADERYQRGKGAVPATKEEAILRDAVIDRMRENGMDVITNEEEGQRVLDESEKRSNGVREQRVWHGSGADFETFDHSHMGEGEGAQAYGWGTYVSEVEGIGRTYAEDTGNKLFRSKFGSYYLQKLREALNNGRSFESEKQRLLDSHSEMYNKAKEKGSGYNDFIHDYEKLGELKENDLPSRHLYTVEITDDNGKNYLDWDKSLTKEELEKVIDAIMASPEDALKMLRRAPVRGSIDEALDKYADNPDSLNKEALKRMLTKYLNGMQFGYVYKEIADVIGKEQTSKLLSGIGFVGIKYPADSMRGGRADGAKNYVIFNEKDAKITDHVRFFRTADGEAYGFTVGGKIYIDPKIANSETPVHEYAHLWASALRQSNAKEWANVVGLMKDTAVWEEVKKHYPELKTDDEIADEVLATYSGRRGAERLRKEMEEATKNGSIFDKAEAMSAMQKIRQALDTFWKSMADFLHIHYTTAEEVADRVMKDLLDGVDPRMMNDGESVESISYQRAESEEESLEKANEKFNEQLAEFTKDNADKINFNLGSPSAKLLSAGVADKPIKLHGSKVAKKMKKHGFSIEELHDLPKAVANPIAVFDNLGKEGNRSVLTELKTANGNFLVAIDLGKGTEADFDIVSSVFGKKGHSVAAWINKGYMRYVDKKKALNYLHLSAPIAEASDNAELSSAAKVIQDFENPKVSDEKVSEDDLYRVVDDKETIERLDAEPKITAYRAMQVIDGKLYSPMAAKVDGKLTDSNPHGTWTEAEESLFDFTPEQKAAMEALDKSNEPGNVELIKGKLRYNKQSKNGKGTLQFHLVKGDGSSLWAAYNPYIHSSMSMLNDQFTSAYKRPNIVVVEVEIPESELTSGYRAQNAKNTVGMAEWKAGPVAGQLPGDMARQVMLSRWSKVKRIVPYSEVADQVAATLSTAEEKTGQKVQLPIESFHPELRKELEKRGFEFQHGKYTEETAKRKAWDDLTDEEKQQAYKGAAYMDDAAIEALNSEYSGEWLKREGEGQATDEEVSLANDPVSKMIGKSRYSAGQQVEYAENMRERMTTHAQELAEKLHLSNVEIVADGSGFTGKRQKAKGFYNKTTGKITVIIGNHTSMADVEKTILHEAVAHHGLRQLFGEHFDQFLDNVYESCDYKIRQKIDALMEEKGYGQRTATEEYLASLAEDMNYETTDPTFWTAIKEAFLDMLHTLGFDYAGPVLTDNELRYILWRSYKNLEEPGSFRSILGTAEDLKMQETLGVGQYETEGKESAAAEDLFREDDISRALNNDSEGAGWSRETMQRAWDGVMSKASFLAKEGYFDYLASVDEFQKLVERATGEKVSDMQNAYKAMLQLSSRNANEMKLFDSAFARPLQRAVYRLIGAVKDFKKGKGLELSWYLISKHGIERNRDMAIRASMKEKAKESYAEQIHEATAELKEERTQLLTELTRIAAGETSPLGTEAAIKARVKQIEAEIDSIKKHPNKHGLKTEAEFYEDELDNWYRTASFIKEYAEENGWTWRETQEELTRRAADFGADVTEDYSGLSALVEEEEDFTEAAYRRVENYENTHYTDDLWEAIRAMSGYSLEKQRSSGLTTKKYVDDQLRRYDFFVPLRGWADPTAEEMYDYLDGQRSELGNPVKTAKGRKSEADNPLGGLLSVAYRSIASGNKNMALQHFYNLVSAHNTSGLAVIDSMWVENRGTEDAPDWVLATPELTDPMTGGREMSAEEVQAELDRFNADMREKAALGMAIQMKKGTPLPPYRVTQQHARAHQIRLSVGGTNRVITIVGNPRVAMALNGLLNPENSGWPILRKLNNFMAGAFTNYNVSFGGANLARDTAHSNLRAFIGESPAYWWALTKKQNLMLGNVANWARMVGMLRKYEACKPMMGYHEHMFKEFMDGGGATGYTMIRNQKESTQFMVDMVRDLKNIKRRKLSPMRMFEFFSFLNEAAELVNRFVAYETSREMGRTRERSIDDAKEATLNFNRKGAGAKSLTQREGAKYRLSNALNYYSQYGRSFIVFFNAHVQGTYQLYRLVKEHPAKFAFAFGAAPVTAAAVALPLFNNLLLPAIYSAVGGDGDDDWGDYYYELSDWERQHNICLRLPKGHGWLKIPLTPELGAMFQVGDVTGASFAGKRDMQASDFAGIMELIAPNNVDFTDAGTAISSLVPSSLQWASHIAVNRDFKGSRLRNDNMFSRYQPEYLKATRSTSATITAMSRALNKVGGGNDERSADNVLDFSPGYVQEMLTGIAGGWASTALAVSDALAAPYLEGGGSEKDYWKGAKGLFDRGGVPVLSRFWISGSGERNAARAKGEYMRTVKPFMGATESEFSLIKRIPRPAALDVRAKEEKLEAAKKSHDLFAIAEAEKSLEAAKANFEEAKKTQRQKLDALQGSERFKAYRDMRGITRYIDYMLRLYKGNDLPDNVVDSLQEANRRLLEVEK